MISIPPTNCIEDIISPSKRNPNAIVITHLKVLSIEAVEAPMSLSPLKNVTGITADTSPIRRMRRKPFSVK